MTETEAPYPFPCPICLAKGTVIERALDETLYCSTCEGYSMQDRTTSVVYDERYISSRYGTYTRGKELSRIRTEIIRRHIYTPDNKEPRTILDFGYGDGEFIRTANEEGFTSAGFDVNPQEYPGVPRVHYLPYDVAAPNYNVITFFDSLEHVPQLQRIALQSYYANWIVVSCPCVPRHAPDLRTWKHYRPGEHHYHFQVKTLERLFTHVSTTPGHSRTATCVHVSHAEDLVRGSHPDGSPNILTVILHCQS